MPISAKQRAALTKTKQPDFRKLQLRWALGGGIPDSHLEERHGQLSWVLKQHHRKKNLFDPGWWEYIQGSEHRWARALNSSQCFGVNLFSPLARNPRLARVILSQLQPGRFFSDQDQVSVLFEYTPAGAAQWLGEAGQPTQIDVCFQIDRPVRAPSFVFVEVKYSERSFGASRGWKQTARGSDKLDCLDVSAILNDHSKCWLVRVEHRRYWEIMAQPQSSMAPEEIKAAGACPFRYGLYQLMRNRVLADEMVRQSRAEWVDVVACTHPANKRLRILAESISCHADAIEAFRSLSSESSLGSWDARRVIELTATAAPELEEWRNWMQRRYFADEQTPK